METKLQFIIAENGTFYREDITRREIVVGDALQRALNANVVSKVHNLLELPSHGAVHLVYTQQDATWNFSVPMETINFRTTFKPIVNEAKYKDQLYPTFAPKETTDTIMEIEWSREKAMVSQDASMRIRFLVQVKEHNGGYYAHDHYLFAFDGRGVAYRMPIANLFDTCQVCMGTYDSKSTTAIGSVILALRQFRSASWNADLFRNKDTVWKFIRFKALEKGFETQSIVGAWTTLCEKVAPPQLKFCDV
jgi:hypothetical protein